MDQQEGIHGRSPWNITVVGETGSTNADLLAAAEAGELADRTVLRTDHQTAGRGRLDRRWDAPPGSNLLTSIHLAQPGERPGEVVQRVGVAIAVAVGEVIAAAGVANGSDTGSDGLVVGVKWPNDVLLGDRKLAGVLAQRCTSTPGLVVGFGVNVGWAPEGAARVNDVVECSPADLLDEVLRAFDALPIDPAEFGATYRRHLLTIGQQVRIHLPADRTVDGLATGVDDDGRIIVRTSVDGGADLEQVFDVGDVVHLRPAPGTTPGSEVGLDRSVD